MGNVTNIIFQISISCILLKSPNGIISILMSRPNYTESNKRLRWVEKNIKSRKNLKYISEPFGHV